MHIIEGGKLMISVKMNQLFQNQKAMAALNKLATCTKYQPTTTIALKAVLRELNESAGKLIKDRDEVLKSLAEKDDLGNPKVVNGQYEMSEENKKSANELYSAFMAQSVEIPRTRIKFSSIQCAELSPEDLLILEGLIDEEA